MVHIAKSFILAVGLLSGVRTAPVEQARVRDVQAARTPLHDAVLAVNAAVSKASIQGSLQDSGVLDDIERLLDIIASHVERIRDATGGNNNNGTSDHNATGAISHHADDTDPELEDNNNNDSPPKKHPPLLADAFAGADDTGPGPEPNINITCNGITVCNPVAILNGKGGRKGQWGKDMGKSIKDAKDRVKKGGGKD
ncbi:98a79abf-0207-4b42-8ca3-87ee192b87ec [Thermothielavioides terrestris]|jgi:hypothetical protein|uniref:Uncharacterized protein n=2 Tax=Thermothielavioides terrestris TaxID=2587410 RepID=G2R3F3_THETT|nr:uncharacterized protein THITE_2113631 [Thermothielavioides terrestris NRRL 8126]AEO65964.1 hypothetical protein THITE_2113631 [Thermothielavioides terrestris NRRL 8126]SPQ18772.1 98a79abf-0207-4b42-8ca3-87ee192b87ec [Thermothielavioides terrestris]